MVIYRHISFERVYNGDIRVYKMLNGDAPERIFFCVVICENDMLRNGNSWLKTGVSFAAHTQYAYIWKYPPPPRDEA